MVAGTFWKKIGGLRPSFSQSTMHEPCFAKAIWKKNWTSRSPEIGQCCGVRALLRFKRWKSETADRIDYSVERKQSSQPEIFIYATGHVGRLWHGHYRCCF